MIIVQDLQHVELDGVNIGSVADAIANYPKLIAQIQASLEAWASTALSARYQVGSSWATAAAQERIDGLTAERDAAVQQLEQLEGRFNTRFAEMTERMMTERNAEIANLRTEAQSQLDAHVARYAAVASDAQSRADVAETEAKFARELQNKHWELCQTLMRQGGTKAALAVYKKIRKIGLAARRADLEAEQNEVDGLPD